MKCLPRSYRSLLILVALGVFLTATNSTTASYGLMGQRRTTAPTAPSSSTAASSATRTPSSPTSAASTTSTPTSKAASITSSATPPPSSSATSSTPTAPATSPPSPAPLPHQPTGYVILNSRITTTLYPATNQTTYLGRPWRPYARVISLLTTELPANINPAGWGNSCPNPANESTAYYAESNSTGPGASPTTRVHWSHQLTPSDAAQFLPELFPRRLRPLEPHRRRDSIGTNQGCAHPPLLRHKMHRTPNQSREQA